MVSFDVAGIPRCTIDYPLEISPSEIASLSGPINTLLKSSYLLGTSFEIENTFDSLFDIAEEIAGVEACGFLIGQENAADSWDIKVSRRIDPAPAPERLPYLVAPAAIAAHFGKAVSMDPQWGPWSTPICEAWSSRSLVSFPLRRDREVIGAIVFGKRDSHPFQPFQVKLLWALSMQAENHLHRSDSFKTLSFYSFLDPLTHLFNRRHFDNQLDKEILRSRRTGEPFSLLMLDLDGFRAYNEKFLHTSGDIALQEFAGILGGCVREVDTVARLGGDEFAVILFESNAEGGQALANRVIQRFRRHLLPGAEEKRTERLSVSVGVASFPADSFDRADLVTKADRALSIARGQGGGRVWLHHETTDPASGNPPAPDLPVRKIYDAGRSVVDMDKFLEILLFTGMQALGAGRGSIVVQDPSGTFTLRAAIGFSRHEEHTSPTDVIRPGAVTSWVVDHQIPLVVSGPEDCPLPLPKKKNGYSSDSFLSIPLTRAGRTMGALHLTNRKDQRPFTREDLQSFAPIASEIAGIIEQGMSFRETVRSFSLSILSSLADALELRYPFLSGHYGRVRDISRRIGERMGLEKEDLETLLQAAKLHDIGIVALPGNLLSLKRRLNDREIEMVRKHPFWGAKMLEGVPGIEAGRRAILEHHENFDGSGYPYGLRGKDISLQARILRVAEYYDSIIFERPYRGGLQPGEALGLVRTGANTLFDPEVSALFLQDLSRADNSTPYQSH